MLILEQGDRLPPVATAQALLRALLPSPTLSVDGAFGPLTANAVRTFQSRNRLRPDGTIAPDTWAALTRHVRLAVRDIVDVFDPLLEQSAATVGRTGSQPIRFGGGSNAIGWIVPSLLQSGAREGSLALLRFHGHGNRGMQVTGYGSGCHVIVGVIRGRPVPPLHECTPAAIGPTGAELGAFADVRGRSSLSLQTLELADVRPALARLGSLFSPWGSIELHGCQVAGGAIGQTFVRRLAEIVGVPVAASVRKQHTSDAVRLVGPIVTGLPRGLTLASWARALPPIRTSF